jgi:hypothetical protein
MKRVLTPLTFALALLLTACSYTTSFVVINATDRPAELRYKVRDSPRDPLSIVGEPLKTAEGNLRSGDSKWQRLSPGEYTVDREARTLTLQLMPHEAVAVRRLTNYRGHDDISEDFAIVELRVQGAADELKLQGEETRWHFLPESDNLYTLTYK